MTWATGPSCEVLPLIGFSDDVFVKQVAGVAKHHDGFKKSVPVNPKTLRGHRCTAKWLLLFLLSGGLRMLELLMCLTAVFKCFMHVRLLSTSVTLGSAANQSLFSNEEPSQLC